jgi:FlaA1/EpsC-like NDP-sugar epimerase
MIDQNVRIVMLMEETILVTGATGTVGNEVVKQPSSKEEMYIRGRPV